MFIINVHWQVSNLRIIDWHNQLSLSFNGRLLYSLATHSLVIVGLAPNPRNMLEKILKLQYPWTEYMLDYTNSNNILGNIHFKNIAMFIQIL